MVALMIPTICTSQLLVRLVIREMSFNEKKFLGSGSSFSEDCEFLIEPNSSLDVEEEQVVFSKPLKSVAENDDSRTQETSPVPEFRLQIQILTFIRNSEHVAVAMLKLLSVMFVLLIILRTFPSLNVFRVKRALTLWRKLKGHNRETNG